MNSQPQADFYSAVMLSVVAHADARPASAAARMGAKTAWWTQRFAGPCEAIGLQPRHRWSRARPTWFREVDGIGRSHGSGGGRMAGWDPVSNAEPAAKESGRCPRGRVLRRTAKLDAAAMQSAVRSNWPISR